jgi:hypothetical protein
MPWMVASAHCIRLLRSLRSAGSSMDRRPSTSKQVARRWSSTIGTAVRPEQVVLCLLDLKVVRLAHDPGHRDSLVDLIGYSVVLHELVRDASATRRSAEVAELAEH